MDLSRIESLINEHGGENAELLADLDTLRTQNSEYDNDFARLKTANDTLTTALENSRAENKRLLGLVSSSNKPPEDEGKFKSKPFGSFIVRR